MKTLVVAATKAEIAFFYQHYNLPDGDFIETKDFDVLITGVGMVATAFGLGRHLTRAHKLVLNLGIAGCFDRHIELGSVVHVTEDTFAELGADSGNDFLSINELGFGESTYTSINRYNIDLPSVSGITVNRVSGNEKSIQELIKRLNPTTESMEGASVFYACQRDHIACLQVRSISNYIEKRNKENWKMGPAVKNLNDWAINFMAQLSRPD